MVLERILGASIMESKPDVGLFLGFIFTLIGFITSYVIFVSGMSVAMIGFSSLLVLPYILKIMKPESPQYESVFSRKSPSIRFFVFLFVGMALAYTILFGILSPQIQRIAFSTQLDIIFGQGAILPSGSFGLPSLFYEIVSNNLVIVAVALLLSYFYGAGSIFVLNYNASIAGIVYGSALHALIWGGSPLFSSPYFFFPLTYLPHTILEILAYLLASIAGIILSKPLTRKNTHLIRRDVPILALLAIILVLAGGVLEVIIPFL